MKTIVPMDMLELRLRLVERLEQETENREDTKDIAPNSYGSGWDVGFIRGLQVVLNTIDNKDADGEEVL
jgi:uncharacterized protein (UPF0335 family)